MFRPVFVVVGSLSALARRDDGHVRSIDMNPAADQSSFEQAVEDVDEDQLPTEHDQFDGSDPNAFKPKSFNRSHAAYTSMESSQATIFRDYIKQVQTVEREINRQRDIYQEYRGKATEMFETAVTQKNQISAKAQRCYEKILNTKRVSVGQRNIAKWNEQWSIANQQFFESLFDRHPFSERVANEKELTYRQKLRAYQMKQREARRKAVVDATVIYKGWIDSEYPESIDDRYDKDTGERVAIQGQDAALENTHSAQDHREILIKEAKAALDNITSMPFSKFERIPNGAEEISFMEVHDAIHEQIKNHPLKEHMLHDEHFQKFGKFQKVLSPELKQTAETMVADAAVLIELWKPDRHERHEL